MVGMIGCTRRGSSWMVPEPSATADTIFRPTQSPLARERAMAWRPRSNASATSAGYRIGKWRSIMVASEEDGRVDDFAAGSSPTIATAPPNAEVPVNTAWRNASDALSRPGALPYQRPMTPS